MSLNIKSEEAHRLAKELSDRTGESMTVAVTEAIRERLRAIKQSAEPDLADRLMEIGRQCAEELRGKPKMRVEDFYDDETGLPN